MTIDFSACRQLLCNGLRKLKIDTNDKQIESLLAYLESFHKWNKAINLSAIRKPEQMVIRHLLDSLVLVPHLNEHLKIHQDNNATTPLRLIDVGTGGGLPGIPLAIYFPNIHVTLLDSNGKKTHFLFQAALKLGLTNISIENKRVESFNPDEKFDIVTSRAFASLSDMVIGTEHLLAPKGQYWAMKGVNPEAELKQCIKKVDLIAAHKLQVPQCNEERHLIVLAPHCD
jgi:16S rRNA (guanine527-N7)-methyltransferase